MRTVFRLARIVLATVAIASPALAADIVWIEAERFEDCGGWIND